MNGVVLGIAMLISSAGTAPVPDAIGARVAPAQATLILPAAPTAAPSPASPIARARPLVRAAAAPIPKKASARLSLTDRIIAVAAGVAVGWVVGGGIGGKITDTSNPHDDTSALKGIIIGAPIGAVTGAILGWRLTK